MKTHHRIKIRCHSRAGVCARCSCGTTLHGAFYPLDLESVADWMREHWIIEHATRSELQWLAMRTIRESDSLRASNWSRKLRGRAA